MGVSKFVVYKLLLLEFHLQLVCQSATGSEHLGNCSTSSGIQANHNKCHTLYQQSTAKIVDIINVKTLVTNAQVKPTQKINYRAPISNNSSTDEVDESEFHFLITGGYRPVVNEIAKFLVSLRSYPRKYFGDSHFCGGSIISRQAILSAAHCFFIKNHRRRPSQVWIIAGTPRRLLKTDKTQVMLVDTIMTHPKYSGRTLRNDVAVILIKGKLKTDGINVDIIPIANTEPKIGAKCTVLGWGTVIQFGPSPDEVINADVYIQPYRTCSRHKYFKKGIFCAGDTNDFEVDSCQGDSGSPLICDGRVAGIVSFGAGCGERYSFGFYSDVYYYRNWINNNRATHKKVNVLPTATFAISIIMQAFRI